MYRCPECGIIFDEPNFFETTWEDYNGVSGMFNEPEHYVTFAACPHCESPIDIEYDIYEEDEE